MCLYAVALKAQIHRELIARSSRATKLHIFGTIQSIFHIFFSRRSLKFVRIMKSFVRFVLHDSKIRLKLKKKKNIIVGCGFVHNADKVCTLYQYLKCIFMHHCVTWSVCWCGSGYEIVMILFINHSPSFSKWVFQMRIMICFFEGPKDILFN